MTERRKPILCLDWDGVIHAYTSGWQGVTVIPDGPVPGAAAFIAAAVDRFRVCIYSSRSDSAEGIGAMQAYLMLWLQGELGLDTGLAIWQKVEWPTTKPPALVTIDDRAVTFTGVWPSLDELAAFRPWNAARPAT